LANAALANRHGPTSARFVLDIGINDGQGPTLPLYRAGYAGLVIEGDETFLPDITKRIPSPTVRKTIAWITPRTIVALLRDADTPSDLDMVKIDIDADDCVIMVVLWQAGYRPRVVQMELNPEIPMPIAFGVLPLPEYFYKFHYGFNTCSLSLMTHIAAIYGYTLVSVGGTKDAIFVLNDVLQSCCQPLPLMIAHALYMTCCNYPHGGNGGANWSKFCGLQDDKRPLPAVALETPQWPKAAYEGTSAGNYSSVLTSIRTYIEIACRLRDRTQHDTCRFAYVLSDDPSAAAHEFIRKVTEYTSP